MSILHVPVTASNLAEWVRRAAGAINQLITGKQDKSDNLTSLSDLDLTGHSGDAVVVLATEDGFELSAGGSGTGDLLSTNNLSDVANAATALSNLGGQPLDSDLTALAALTTTAYGRSLLEAANASALRTLAGTVIGTDVQAYDADLAALAALSGTNTLYYRSAVNTWSAVTVSPSLSFTGGTLDIARGTSFPGSPATGDLFRRSDRGGIEYRYDGTRWLSTQLFTMPVATNAQDLPFNATNGAFNRNANPHAGAYDIYVIDVIVSYILVGTGNFTLTTSDSIGALATNSGLTATSQTVVTTSINSVRSNSTCKVIYYTVTENSGTADFYPAVAITYRLVG